MVVNKWTPEEESKLINIMILNKYTYQDVPWHALATKFKDRTAKSIQAKVGRLLKNDPDVFNRYEWSSAELKGAFRYYLDGESFAKIHERLVAFGSKASIKDLESKMLEMREDAIRELKAYAEERNLKIKHITLDLLKFFLQNKDTTSQLTRTGLHSRIQHG